jgi:adenosylhomocysteinase
MDGFWVMPMSEAAPLGDLFVTLTGDMGVIRPEHFEVMKDGAVVANSGHFNVEIDLEGLNRICESRRPVRPQVEEYRLADGRRINVLAEGRLVNLAAGEGHPAVVMDMSFANQALSAEYLAGNSEGLENRVYDVPADIDEGIARLKLRALGTEIDVLTDDQVEYLSSWEAGT